MTGRHFATADGSWTITMPPFGARALCRLEGGWPWRYLVGLIPRRLEVRLWVTPEGFDG